MVYACRLLMIWAFIPFGMNAQTAKWAIAPQYSSITPYGEDMYKVKIGKQVGVVDKDGKIIVGVCMPIPLPIWLKTAHWYYVL